MAGSPAVIIALALLLLLKPESIASAAASSSQKSSPLDTKCRSLECLNLAAEIVGMMNQTADPCTNFYNYACGNFPQLVRYNHAKAHVGDSFATTLFEDSLSVMGEQLERNMFEMLIIDREISEPDSDINQLYNFTRLLYRSCGEFMQQSRVGDDDRNRDISVEFFRDVYQHLMLSIDPILRPAGSFESVLAALTKAGGSGVLNVKLTSSIALQLLTADDQSAENLTRASIETNDRYYSCRPVYAPFIDFFLENQIAQSLSLANQSDQFGDLENMLTCSSVDSDGRSVVEVKFDNCNCTVLKGQTEFTIAELDALSRCVQPENPFLWSRFFKSLLHADISNNTLLQVRSIKAVTVIVNYFKELPLYTTIGEKFNERVSFLVFDWMMNFADFLPRKLRKSWQSIGKTMNSFRRLTDDVVGGCLLLVKQQMQPIVERMYEKIYHPAGSFEDVKNLLHLLKTASIDSVKRQDWITRSAKEAIAGKIRHMQHSIGTRQVTAGKLKLFYNSTLRAFNSTDLSDGLRDSFGSLFTLALCAEARKNFDLIASKSPISIFMAINPLEVNAFNFQQKNRIIFPMAILAPRVYHKSYPVYLKLGSLGYIIGHEIGHGFDDEGHEINRRGASGHFWDRQTEEAFLSRMDCVRREFSNYTLYPGGPYLDADSSLGNNIADLIGIRAAYFAMQLTKPKSPPLGDGGRWTGNWKQLPGLNVDFSEEQLFFIQAAQSWCFKAEPESMAEKFGGATTHAPHAIRVDGIARHTPEFAEAFQCPASDRKKCTFW
ncbi:hypothetical protein BOX15_Mlig033612g2 [Macrostomum lignano]|uniref:Peptidase_M13 domain-containing protein n=1 Tax=Macrostomum lignano TaxID=282301 RepID=A0A267F9C1_9PLAT|nr:hypothetical protein BOX15_Mlig033612g2 [Macrostomum lignano]